MPALPAPESAPAPERQYQRLAQQLLRLIAQGDLRVGERLPSERMLAERFDVSRTSVREAIIALEVQGMLEVRGGSGVYVCQSALPTAPQTCGPGPLELLRARALIEAEVAAAAAQWRSDAQLDRMFVELTHMRVNVQEKETNEAADQRFHLEIAASTGNSVLLQMVGTLWRQARESVLWQTIDHHFHTPQLRQASLADHQRIFQAISERHADDARVAMREHIERVMHEFTQAWR